MKRMAKNQTLNAEKFKKIMMSQRYPFEANVLLSILAERYHVSLEAAANIFCLGIIFGKREVRQKRKA